MFRGYCGIGIENIKTAPNYGTLFRSASILGAAFVFVIGKRFKKQGSDTMASYKHIPTYEYTTIEEFYENIPYGCKLIGVEILDDSLHISDYKHPERAIYLLGAEDSGLSMPAINKCNEIIQLPGDFCLNVSVAGSIVMYDRYMKNAGD